MGKFIKELNAAVYGVKSNKEARHDVVTLQMTLLEHKIEVEDRCARKIDLKLIRQGRPIQEIHEDTDLSLEHIHQLTQKASKENDHVK